MARASKLATNVAKLQNVSAKPADPLLCVGQLLSLRLRLGRVADCHIPTD